LEANILPSFVWPLFFYFFIFTFLTTITILFSMNNFKKISSVNIFFVIAVPYSAFVSGVGVSHPRHPLYDLNEIELLIYGLRQGAFSAYFITLGLIFIITWWILLLIKIKNFEIKLSFRQRVINSLLVGIGLYFLSIILTLPVWEFWLLPILSVGIYFLIFAIGDIIQFLR